MPINEDFSLESFLLETANVPCNGCNVCCKNEQVIIAEDYGDILEKYQTHQEIKSGQIVDVLDHQKNGDCIYLIENKCSIYESRPFVCRTYDCRVDFLSHTQKVKKHVINPNFEEGKKRLHTLDSRRRRGAIALRKLREKISIQIDSN